MRLALLSFFLMIVAAPAKAEEPPTWKEIKQLELAYQTLNVIDAVQTIDCLDRNVCRELNPLLGRNPSAEKVIAFKAGGGIIHFLITRAIYERDPYLAKRFQVLSLVVQGGVVAANLRFAF